MLFGFYLDVKERFSQLSYFRWLYIMFIFYSLNSGFFLPQIFDFKFPITNKMILFSFSFRIFRYFFLSFIFSTEITWILNLMRFRITMELDWLYKSTIGCILLNSTLICACFDLSVFIQQNFLLLFFSWENRFVWWTLRELNIFGLSMQFYFTMELDWL